MVVVVMVVVSATGGLLARESWREARDKEGKGERLCAVDDFVIT